MGIKMIIVFLLWLILIYFRFKLVCEFLDDSVIYGLFFVLFCVVVWMLLMLGLVDIERVGVGLECCNICFCLFFYCDINFFK